MLPIALPTMASPEIDQPANRTAKRGRYLILGSFFEARHARQQPQRILLVQLSSPSRDRATRKVNKADNIIVMGSSRRKLAVHV